jgi:hypothetical protein
MSQFYLTASSDSDCQFQGENSISKFRVHLGRIIELAGNWEVALFEISYPQTYDNIRNRKVSIFKENTAIIENSLNVVKIISENHLDRGYYQTPEVLCTALNQCTNSALTFSLDESRNTVITAFGMAMYTEKISYSFSDELSDILGISRNIVVKENEEICSDIPFDLRKGHPKTIKVYTDFVADQIVNNSHEKLLRELPLHAGDFSYGFQKHHTFDRLVFLPVIKRNLEFLEFHIKDEQNSTIAFSHGILKVVLLFRRVEHGIR